MASMDREVVVKGIELLVRIFRSERSSSSASHDEYIAQRQEEIDRRYPVKPLPSKVVTGLGGSPTPTLVLANTAETIEELRSRLGKELYKMELDLANGGRINGKPCDCLSKKHKFGLEATAEEMMSYEHKPVHGEIITWLNRHAPEFEPAEIAKHDPEYYRALIPEVRAFRKEVMGTEKLTALARS